MQHFAMAAQVDPALSRPPICTVSRPYLIHLAMAAQVACREAMMRPEECAAFYAEVPPPPHRPI